MPEAAVAGPSGRVRPGGGGGGTVGRDLGPGDRPRVVAHLDLDAF